MILVSHINNNKDPNCENASCEQVILNNKSKLENNMSKKVTPYIINNLLPITIIILISIPLFNYLISNSTRKFPYDFWGKDYLVSRISNFQYFVMKDRVYDQKITNTEGWFMLSDQASLDDFQKTNLYTADQLSNVGNKLSYLCEFLTNHDIDFIFITPPNKNTIYPEFMPSEVPIINKKSRIDQIAEIWQETDHCTMLDLRDTLLEGKTASQIYFATDTHWNENGIFLAHQELVKILIQKYPSIAIPRLDDYNLAEREYQGDLIGKNYGQISISEISTFFTPIGESEYYLISSVGKWGLEINDSYNRDTNLPTAVVYRDSFLSRWIPFMAQIFREAHYYWTYKIDPSLIISEHPNIMIYEITERVMINLLLLPDKSQYDNNW